MRTIHMGSDHAGYALKETLKAEAQRLGLKVVDHGANSAESCDYALIAHPLCESVAADGASGILVCGSGIGMSMAANRHPEIRAALCAMEVHARLARRHNDANVLCLGARITGDQLAIAIMAAFLETQFEGGRHERRVAQITPCRKC